MADEADELRWRAEARVGTVLAGKYTLDHLLGYGGTAAVYSATHRNKKQVAVKVLHRDLSRDDAVRERFLREGYAANSVGHRGVVRVDDDDVSEDGSAFLVMELLVGETVEARQARKGGRLPAEEVLSIADQVLDTLAAAHEKGIVHRDLKPENLFLTRRGQIKVLDFGIAHLRERAGSATATEQGTTLGTPAFMPPEQARGRWTEVDAQSDLWALGATLYSLLTGRFVHEGGTVNESLALAITERARPVREVAPDTPPEVAAIIDRALQYEKEQRWPDARAMQAAVRETFDALRKSEADAAAAPVASAPFASLPDMGPDTIDVVVDEAAIAAQASAIAQQPYGGLPTPQLATSRAVDEVPSFRPSRWPLVLGALGGVAAVAGLVSLATSSMEQDTSSAPVGAPSGQAQVHDGVEEPETVSVDDLPAVGGGRRRKPTAVAAARPAAPPASPAAPSSDAPAPPSVTASAPPSPAPAPPRTKAKPPELSRPNPYGQ